MSLGGTTLKKLSGFIVTISAIVLLFGANLPTVAAAQPQTYHNDLAGITFTVPTGDIVADVSNHDSLNVHFNNSALMDNEIQIIDSKGNEYCSIIELPTYCWDLNEIPESGRTDFLSHSPMSGWLGNPNGRSFFTSSKGCDFYILKNVHTSLCVTVKNGEAFCILFYEYPNSPSSSEMKAFIDTVSFDVFPKPYSNTTTTYSCTDFKVDLPAQYVAINKDNIQSNAPTLKKWYYTTDSMTKDFSDNSALKLFAQNYFNNFAVWIYQSNVYFKDFTSATQKQLDDLKTNEVSYVTSLKTTVTSADFALDSYNKIKYLAVKYYDDKGNYVRYIVVKNNFEYEIICTNDDQSTTTDFTPLADSFVPLAKQPQASATIKNTDYFLLQMAPFIFLLLVICIIAITAIVLPIVLILSSGRKKHQQANWPYEFKVQVPKEEESESSVQQEASETATPYVDNFDKPNDHSLL